MLRILALSFALLVPATFTAVALPEPGGSFVFSGPQYAARLDWAGGPTLDADQATLTVDVGPRTATVAFRFEHVSDVFTLTDTGLRPTLARADVSGNVVALVYDFAATGALPETSSTLVFTFHDDAILYDTTSHAPNAVYASYMRAVTELAWPTEWASAGVFTPQGILPGDDGAALDPFQEWEVSATYGVYFAEPTLAIAQARLVNGLDVNYLDEGDWTVDRDGATTATVYNSFLDAPTAGSARALWTSDAIVLGASPSAVAARAVVLGATSPIIPRASQDEQAIIGLADDGINPYHLAFRDTSPLAYQHPSTYIAGYPASAEAVYLTLDADTLDDALVADRTKWVALRADQLYWFPGTKIVGAISDGDVPQDPAKLIFSTAHGTMTGSRAAGNEYSLCPECRIVMHQGFSTEAIAWLTAQSWIDVQSHSWSGAVPFNTPVEFAGVRDAMEDAADEMPVFTSGGNGAAGKLGVLGHPSFTRPMAGAKGAIPVGGHDNGFMTPWTAQYPYVSADACASWAPIGDTLAEYGPEEGSGTSASTPYTAGEAGRLILEARRVLGGPGDREAGVLASGPPRPDLGTSPLADGDLTVEELKSVLFRTATARPVATRDDGVVCGATWAPYLTLPIAWSSYPADVSAYPHIGWGGIDVTSVARAIDVLHGAPMPVRPVDEEAHAQAETIRGTWHSIDEAAAVEFPDVPLPTVWEQNDAGSGGDAGDAPSGAVPVAPGVVHEGRLSWVDEDYDDMFAISLQAGDVVRIDLAGIGVCPHFYSPSGWEFTPAPSCAYPGVASSATFTAASSGTHHLAVGAFLEHRYAFGFGVNGPAPDVGLPPPI